MKTAIPLKQVVAGFAPARKKRIKARAKELIAGEMALARQYPKFTTIVQRGQNDFRKKYSGPLHVVTRKNEYFFEKVLSFKGPL